MPESRATWTGSISLGLVTIPIALHTATEAKNELRFNQLHRGCEGRIKMKRVCDRCDIEVPFEDVVKGYEVAKDQYVVVDPTELAELTPTSDKLIEITGFIDPADVDPIYLDSTYYAVPNGGAEKGLSTIIQAMDEKGVFAIGKFVMRAKEYLYLMRPVGDTLAISTLHWHDQVRSAADYEVKTHVPERELEMARQLIDAFRDTFKIEDWEDTYRTEVLAVIDAKAAGKELPKREEKSGGEVAGDLFAALEASVEAAKAAKKKVG